MIYPESKKFVTFMTVHNSERIPDPLDYVQYLIHKGEVSTPFAIVRTRYSSDRSC